MDKLSGLTEGRIVHFVMGDGTEPWKHRPAIVVNAHPGHERGVVNLVVYADGKHDIPDGPFVFHKDNIPYSEEKIPSTWHWPEKA